MIMTENKARKCSNCGNILQFSHVVDFKIGQTDSDLISLLISPPKNSEEGLLPLEVFICPACGCVQLVAGPEIKNSLVRISENRSPEKEKKG